MTLEPILTLFSAILGKIPFFRASLEKRKFDTQYAKEILELFNSQEFENLTDNILHGYFYRNELSKIKKLGNLICEKRFFNKKILNKLEIFTRELNEFLSWSANEFSSEPNSDRIKLDKYLTSGQMSPNHSDNVEKCSLYANNLSEKCKQIYFEIQEKYPQVFAR